MSLQYKEVSKLFQSYGPAAAKLHNHQTKPKSLELSLSETFAPENKSSIGGTFVTFLEAKVPWNFRSQERIFNGRIKKTVTDETSRQPWDRYVGAEPSRCNELLNQQGSYCHLSVSGSYKNTIAEVVLPVVNGYRSTIHWVIGTGATVWVGGRQNEILSPIY